MVAAEQLEIGVVVVEHYNAGRIVRYKKELRKRKLEDLTGKHSKWTLKNVQSNIREYVEN
jgi:hypothetical protein